MLNFSIPSIFQYNIILTKFQFLLGTATYFFISFLLVFIRDSNLFLFWLNKAIFGSSDSKTAILGAQQLTNTKKPSTLLTPRVNKVLLFFKIYFFQTICPLMSNFSWYYTPCPDR